MKKYISQILLITVTGILFSSCSNLSKMSLTKRHYRSGYYVDFGHKTSHSTAPKITRQSIKTNCQISLLVASSKPEKEASAFIKRNVSGKANTCPKIALYKKMNAKDIKNVNYISSKPNELTQNITNKPGLNNENEVHARVDIDIPFVIIVLCAIFIPPLGVGLMYGINNSYFWIDLILTLIFFFPGMIFALIVVLM